LGVLGCDIDVGRGMKCGDLGCDIGRGMKCRDLGVWGGGEALKVGELDDGFMMDSGVGIWKLLISAIDLIVLDTVRGI